MLVHLASIAVSAGGLALLYVILTRGRAALAGARRFSLLPSLVFLAGATVLPALFALPSHPPFAAGFALGWGVLIGGVLGMLVWLDAAAPSDPPALRAVGPLTAVTLGAGGILLRFTGDPTDVIMGFALGAGIVGLAGSLLGRLAAAQDGCPPLHRSMELYAVAAAVVAAGIRLGIAHFPRSTPGAVAGGYWALPVLGMAVAVLVLILSAGKRGPASPVWLPAALAAVSIPLAAAILQVKLLPQPTWTVGMVGLLALGAFTGLLTVDERIAPAPSRPLAATVGLILVTLAASALAFRTLQAFGEALLLLPALVFIGTGYVAEPAEQEPLAGHLGMGALGLLTIFTLSRLLYEHFGYVHALDFQRYYDSFALLVGMGIACAGLVLSVHGAAWRTPAPLNWRGVMGRLALLGLLSMVTPFAMGMLWGVKTLTALLTGAGVGVMAWMLLSAWSTGEERRQALAHAPVLPMLLLTLVGVQVAPRLLMEELPRTQKVTVLLALVGITVIVTAVNAVARWRKEAHHVEA